MTEDPIKKEKKNLTLVDEEEAAETPEEPLPSIMALYTALMMLLMTFFIVLFSMGTTSTGKFHKAKKSVQDEFSDLGLSATKRAIVFLYSFMKVKQVTSNQKNASNPATNNSPSEEKSEDDADSSGSNSKPQGRAYWEEGENPEKSSKIQQLILSGFDIEKKDENLIIRIPNEDLFYPRTAELKAKGEMLLRQAFRVLTPEFSSLTVRCYTGQKELPTNPQQRQKAFSYMLSAQRAKAVGRFVNELLEQLPEKISLYGYGDFRPIYFNPQTEKEHLMNNRTEFWIKGLWLDTAPSLPKGPST